MKDFLAAVDLIKRIAPRAQKMDHHPDLHLTGYRKLKVVLSTHDAGGLSLKDFRLAAIIETFPKKLRD
jgi:4a-hydroxytetrahydrobiopterin dehydratase